ncbi:hypothetical protein [Kamptonema formosum]|uniref:hypothetical protein n=1 Tax=Kamptonema formosum TaxID=331992 RepID=UPI0012DFE7B7|nr:hypothetical protein [Oscillatoria sp. PCC 10802]
MHRRVRRQDESVPVGSPASGRLVAEKGNCRHRQMKDVPPAGQTLNFVKFYPLRQNLSWGGVDFSPVWGYSIYNGIAAKIKFSQLSHYEVVYRELKVKSSPS